MNTLLNNFDFIQNILVIHQQLKDSNFNGTLQLNENYLILKDSNQEISYNLNDGTQLNPITNLDLLEEPVEEISIQSNESSTNNRVNRLVKIINTEVLTGAIIANIQYQF